MQFVAKVRHNFHVYHTWKKQNKIKGLLSGVLFHKRGHDYVTDELDAIQVQVLMGHPGVELEGASVIPQVSSAHVSSFTVEEPVVKGIVHEEAIEPFEEFEEDQVEKPVVKKAKPPVEEVKDTKPKRRGRKPKA